MLEQYAPRGLSHRKGIPTGEPQWRIHEELPSMERSCVVEVSFL